RRASARIKPLHVQASISQSPTETIDESVFHQPSRTNETQLNAVGHHSGWVNMCSAVFRFTAVHVRSDGFSRFPRVETIDDASGIAHDAWRPKSGVRGPTPDA